MGLTTGERVLLRRRLRRRGNGHSPLLSIAVLVIAAATLTPMAALLMAVAGTGTAYAVLAGDLEEGVAKLQGIEGRELFQTTRIYDRNGVLLREMFGEGRRTYIPLSEMPEHVRLASIAVEDKTFYTNPGVDVTGIMRAVQGVVTGQPGLGGGSTITQQFVRHVVFSYEERRQRRVDRKAKEILLALLLTRQYSKDKILELYLNEIYYGNLAYGIEAAAQTVFGKSAKELNLSEAALLAGLPQAPGDLDPLKADPDVQRRVRNRQRVVLNLMAENGFITRRQADAAADAPLAYKEREDRQLMLAPHFVTYVQSELERMLDPRMVAEGGLVVVTTLDYELQQLGERVVREQVDALRDKHHMTNGALVALEPGGGQILAMVGSADFWNEEIDGEVNVAIAERQPGSSIKPIVYATAIERGMSPAAFLWDVKTEFGGSQEIYEPHNYDERFHGPVRLRDALANSYNIPAVKLLRDIPPLFVAEDPESFDAYMQDLLPNFADRDLDANPVQTLGGIELAVATAHRMGITGLNRDFKWYGLSLTLGGGEARLLDMTTAYATLANGGERVRPSAVLRISDARGNTVYDLLEDRESREPYRAVDERVAHIVTSFLSDNEARTPAFGPNSPLKLGIPAAVKTGTTDEYRDNWTIGYTPYLVTGVWAGNSDNTPMRRSSGVTGAAPIWNGFMRNAAVDPEMRARVRKAREDLGLPFATDFARPRGLVEKPVCRLETLKQLRSTCTDMRPELFIADRLPPEGEPHDVVRTVDVAVVQMPPSVEAAAEAAAAGLPPPQGAPLLCQAGAGAPGSDKLARVVVLPLPEDEKERRFVLEWARSTGFSSVEPTTSCTPELANAAMMPGEATLDPTGAFGASGPVQGPAVYRLDLAPGAVLDGAVTLTGTVSFDPSQIEYFKIELGAGERPNEWITIGTTHAAPVSGGALETLDAGSLAPGPYIVRLVLVKKDGNFLNPPHSVPIVIQH